MPKQTQGLISYDEVHVHILRGDEWEYHGVITPWHCCSRSAWDSHVNRMMNAWARVPAESFRFFRAATDVILSIYLVNPTVELEILEPELMPRWVKPRDV